MSIEIIHKKGNITATHLPVKPNEESIHEGNKGITYSKAE